RGQDPEQAIRLGRVVAALAQRDALLERRLTGARHRTAAGLTGRGGGRRRGRGRGGGGRGGGGHRLGRSAAVTHQGGEVRRPGLRVGREAQPLARGDQIGIVQLVGVRVGR